MQRSVANYLWWCLSFPNMMFTGDHSHPFHFAIMILILRHKKYHSLLNTHNAVTHILRLSCETGWIFEICGCERLMFSLILLP